MVVVVVVVGVLQYAERERETVAWALGTSVATGSDSLSVVSIDTEPLSCM
jgi:hypothetical protein